MNARHTGMAKIWVLNVAGNAALLACGYLWLQLPDAHGWQVGFSALLAIAMVFCGLWLRTGSLAYFRLADYREHAAVWRAFHDALSYLVPFAIWGVPLMIVEWMLFSLRRYTPQFGVWYWQKFSALRFGSPHTVFHTAEWLLWIVMFLVFALWLPGATTIAAAGFRSGRLSRSFGVLQRGSYWLWFWLLMIVGVYLPYKLIWWIPSFETLQKQAWSAGARFVLAYVVIVSAWVGLLLVVGRRAEAEDPQSPNAL